MRRTNKSWMAISAGTIGFALVVAGCGSSDTGSGDASTAATEEDITLTVATFNEFGYEDLLTEYMALNPNITVQQKKAATGNEARDNLNTRLAAGSGLSDIEAIEVDWVPELMQYSDEFVDLSSPDVEGRWLDWKVAQVTTPDGKLIGYGTDIGPLAVCYRSDLFAAAGLPTDREEVATMLGDTWDGYFAAGKQFVASSDVPWFDSAAGGVYQAMIHQVPNAFEESDGTPIPLTENEAAKAVYDTVLGAVDDGLSARLSQWSDDWTNAFQNDGFATMLCPGWMLGVIEGNAAGVTGWDVADTFPGGGGNWGGSFLTVPTQGAHPVEAQALADWLTAPEQQIKAFTAKGTFPSQVAALDSPELLTQTNAFFNDAPVGQIFADRAAAVEVKAYQGPNYFAFTNAVSDAIVRVEVDQTDDANSSWDKAVTAMNELGLG